MKPGQSFILALALIVAITASVSTYSSHNENKRLQSQIAASKAELGDASKNSKSEIDGMSAKLAATELFITNQASELTGLYKRLDDMSSMARRLQALESGPGLQEKKQQWIGEVVAPEAQIVTDETGRETRQFTFKRLTGADGLALGANMVFLHSIGRSLLFKSSSGSPIKFDIDTVHPGVLAQLGIDVEESAKAQEVMNEQRNRQFQQDTILRQMLAVQRREDAEVDFNRAAKAAEINAQQSAAFAQHEQAMADQRRARAMEAAAAAAALNASRPPVQVNVSQSQAQ